jgi:hemerythrin superfamily protein
MSVIDRVVAAITPPEGEHARFQARLKARETAKPGDWLSTILDHHQAIEDAFAKVRRAKTAKSRRSAEKRLGLLLNGHSMAEEAAVYPAIAEAGKKGHANLAYTEQAAAKMQLAALATMGPMTQDYLDKLGHLEGAVLHHIYQEESDWFLDLAAATASVQQHVTQRYAEEFKRYMGPDAPKPPRKAETEARTFAKHPPKAKASSRAN